VFFRCGRHRPLPCALSSCFSPAQFSYALQQSSADASPALEEPRVFLVRRLTLGLEIGATVAVFSINYAVMIRRLPFADPARLAAVFRSEIANLGAPTRRQGSPAHVDDPVTYLGLKKVGETAQVLCLKWSGREDLTPTPAGRDC
jgi:hypothetical protein